MEPLLYTVVFAINFLGFFIKGIAGFGNPLITSPLLSFYFDNKVISPNNLLLSIPLNARIAWKNRHAFSVKTALPVLAFMLLGIVPGTILLKYASSWVLKAGLGLLTLGIGAEMITRDCAKPTRPNRAVMALVCFCSGITSGLYGINLFFIAYMERTTSGRDAFRGNICFVFLIENICRMLIYTISGVFTKDVLFLTAVSLPGMLLGFFVGSRTDKKLSERTVRNVVITMFMLGGFSILLKALIWKA